MGETWASHERLPFPLPPPTARPFGRFDPPCVQSSIDTCIALLEEDLSPAEAAEHLIMEWTAFSAIPAEWPPMVQRAWESEAWRRFEDSNPAVRRLRFAHFLYRAATHVGAFEDLDASAELISRAKRLVREVAEDWLYGRTCPCCVDKRLRLKRI